MMITAYRSSNGSVIASLNNIPSVKYLQRQIWDTRAGTSHLKRKRKKEAQAHRE
jgi:hypothetical protein